VVSLTCVTEPRTSAEEKVDRRALILQEVLRLLARDGIPGVSMRAVAREAGVALGLVHYYFDDKTSLIAASLRQVEEQDLAIVAPDPALPADQRLRVALRRVADPEFLTTEYLSLRLQLWALAQVHEQFAEINIRGDQHQCAEPIPRGPGRADPRGRPAALPCPMRPGHRQPRTGRRRADVPAALTSRPHTVLRATHRAERRLPPCDGREQVAGRGLAVRARQPAGTAGPGDRDRVRPTRRVRPRAACARLPGDRDRP
jgi:AcrR family transcriptional regulator